MKAAVVTAAGKTPIYSDFPTAIAKAGEELRTSIRIKPIHQIASVGLALQFRRLLSLNRRGGWRWHNAGWHASLFRLARAALRRSRRVLSHERQSMRETPRRSR